MKKLNEFLEKILIIIDGPATGRIVIVLGHIKVLVDHGYAGGYGKVQQRRFEYLIPSPCTEGRPKIQVFELIMFQERVGI